MANRLTYYDALKFAEQIRKKTTLGEFMEKELGLHVRGVGEVSVSCPLGTHRDSSPSFRYYPATDSFYCFGCIQEDELIWSNNGLLRIGDVKPGQLVLNRYGECSKVSKVTRKVKDTLSLTLDCFREPLVLTNDHICIFLKSDSVIGELSYISSRKDGKKVRYTSKLRKFNKKHNLNFVELPTSSVEVGDFFAFPVIRSRENRNLYSEEAIRQKLKGPQGKRIYELPATKDAARLYGYYLSKGSYSSRTVRFTFNIEELEYAEDVKRLLANVFGLEASEREEASKNIREVYCCNVDLGNQLDYWFGLGAENKKLPFQCLSWHTELQEALIDGYFAGDRHKLNKSAITVSRELAYGMYALLIQAKQLPSLSARKSYIDKKGIEHKSSWIVGRKKKQSVSGFYEEINGTVYYISRISSINPYRVSDSVVDLEVEGTESFVTKMAVVHNCKEAGDLIKFAGIVKKWSWFKTVRYFADKYNISHDITTEDIADRIFEQYAQNFKRDLDELDVNSVNYLVSSKGKQLLKDFPFSQVFTIVENTFKQTDESVLSKDRTMLFRLKYSMVPSMDELREKLRGIKDKLDDVALDNKTCSSCFMRYQCDSVVPGRGNFLTRVMILADAPGGEVVAFSGPLGQRLQEFASGIGYDINEVWLDYIQNCYPKNTGFKHKDSLLCKRLWLEKRIQIIKPIAIMTLGENATKALLEESIELNSYLNSSLKKRISNIDIDVWPNLNPLELNSELEQSVFMERLQGFMRRYVPK